MSVKMVFMDPWLCLACFIYCFREMHLPFPKQALVFICLLKTVWENKKLLVTSNFSFSHSVFYSFEKLSAIFIKFYFVICKLLSLEESKISKLSFGKGFQNTDCIEKIVEKGEIAHFEQFHLFMPPHRKIGDILFYHCPSVRLSVHLSVCLSVCTNLT